jgi:hypothetical protein
MVKKKTSDDFGNIFYRLELGESNIFLERIAKKSLTSKIRTFNNINDLPEVFRERLSVLKLLDHTKEVSNLGRKISDKTFWIYIDWKEKIKWQ